MIATLPKFSTLVELERRDGWVQVRLGKKLGWVELGARGEAGEPLLGSAAAIVLPVLARAPDAAELKRALAALGPDAKAGKLGPYTLQSDLLDAPRLALLDRVASQIEALYAARYGRTPLGQPAEAIVLFAREADYVDYRRGVSGLERVDSWGHTSHGLIATFDDGRPSREMAETVVHEIVHLLNRRALGPALPGWLDEGIADDLASSAITEDGTVDPSRLGGAVFRAGSRVQYFGARASLRRLLEARAEGRMPSLEAFLTRAWEENTAEPQLAYAQASLFVRYLASDAGALRTGFLGFLEDISLGREASVEALRARLDRPWSEIEQGFAGWLITLASG